MNDMDSWNRDMNQGSSGSNDFQNGYQNGYPNGYPGGAPNGYPNGFPNGGKKPKKDSGVKRVLLSCVAVVLAATIGVGARHAASQVKSLATSESADTAAVETIAVEEAEEAEAAVESEVAEESQAAEESAATTTDSEPYYTAEELDAMIRPVMKENFGECFELTVTEEEITVSVWQDGVAEAAAQLIQNSSVESLQEVWDTLVDAMVTLNTSIRDVGISAGYTDYSCTLYVLNDQNTENTLLYIYNGVVLYDVVNDN